MRIAKLLGWFVVGVLISLSSFMAHAATQPATGTFQIRACYLANCTPWYTGADTLPNRNLACDAAGAPWWWEGDWQECWYGATDYGVWTGQTNYTCPAGWTLVPPSTCEQADLLLESLVDTRASSNSIWFAASMCLAGFAIGFGIGAKIRLTRDIVSAAS